MDGKHLDFRAKPNASTTDSEDVGGSNIRNLPGQGAVSKLVRPPTSFIAKYFSNVWLSKMICLGIKCWRVYVRAVRAKMLTSSFVALSDLAILDLLRKREAMTVAEFSESLGVTATAVRQRLNRLMAQHLIERSAAKNGRGRPKHWYRLTSKGLRKAGSNFSDLAVALWQEIRAIRDPEVRRGLLQRVAKRMAVMYADTVEGKTLEQKVSALADLFGERRVPLELDKTGPLPVLKAVACPYPELADQDRSICAMERLLFAEVLGADVRLVESRLDGKPACVFELN